MLAWMIYVATVSLLLGASAFAAERAARVRRAPSRGIWALTIVASLLIPAIVASISIELPSIANPTAVRKSITLRAATSARLSPSNWIAGPTGDTKTWRSLDSLLQRSWLIASGALLVFLLVSGAHLFWRKRRWSTGSVAGTNVYIATDVGPAVVGLLRPRIVVPLWLTQAPATRQAIVIAHEQSHLDARDQQLLTLGLCLLVFMPWNLPLWWQLRRLRYAIEVDCDARVLKSGHPPIDYGETLIEVGARQASLVGPVAAMSESKSFLEERIRIMMRKQSRWWRVTIGALGCMSLGLIAVAAQVSPPNAESSAVHANAATEGKSPPRMEIAVDSGLLDSYAGHYQFGESAVMTITRDGPRLSAQLTGQAGAPIFPESDTEFFSKIVDAQFTFIADARGQATALILHQNGAHITAPRIDAAVAQQIDAARIAKVSSQTATPGSEAALRELIEGLRSGEPKFNRMTSELAQVIREQQRHLQSGLAELGTVVSIEFRGVGDQGWDLYDVRHERGATQWRIALASNGMVTGVLVSSGP